MRLEKAIELLELAQKPDFEGDANDFYDAVTLGIEALKRVLGTRVEPRYSSVDPLSGETDV